jgi:hypothetical protein
MTPNEDTISHGPNEHGLGAIPSPPDPRDFPVSQLYAAAGIETAAIVVPSSFMIRAIPATSNQGTSPMCVAHSEAYEKLHQDLLDQGLFTPNRSAFFYAIGGGPEGAVGRYGLSRLLNHGYDSDNAAAHRIAAYYAVPVDRGSLQAAIYSFGGVLLGVHWPHSWFHPSSTGILPKPDYDAGGHFIYAIGYDSGGVWVLNSWGSAWGVNGGRAKIPWAYLGRVFEAWKTTDVLEWVARKAICKTTVRTGPGGSYPIVGSVAVGGVAMCAAGQAITGSSWTLPVACNGVTKGTGWWKVRAVNGQSAQALYGHSVVYTVTGRMR